MTANYQDVTPEMIRAVAEFLSNDPSGDWTTAGRLVRVATALEADAKLDAEAEELEALGGTEAAERGWNALRKHNPNVDKSNGLPGGEIQSFSDLSHRQKVNYAVFAAGVLDVKREPRVFHAQSDIPIEVQIVLSADGNIAKRKGSGWWYVNDITSPVPTHEESGDGWDFDDFELPATEYVQEIN